MERDRMARDVEVLQQVMDSHGLTVKHIAARTGIAQQSVYKYMGGIRTLPSDVLRAAFELSGDTRILALITGSVPVEFSLPCARHEAPAGNGEACIGRNQPVRVPPIDQVLPQTLDTARRVVECGEYLAKIFADGRFDRNDLAAAAKFQEHCAAAQTQLATCAAAVEGERERIERCHPH